MTFEISNNTTTLLIIDDEGSVRRALSRILFKYADKILTASNMTDAQLILDTDPVTHILCDQLLGPGQPTGTESAIFWKDRYPSIKKLFILTGTKIASVAAPEGIDKVLPKTTDPLQLAAMLELKSL